MAAEFFAAGTSYFPLSMRHSSCHPERQFSGLSSRSTQYPSRSLRRRHGRSSLIWHLKKYTARHTGMCGALITISNLIASGWFGLVLLVRERDNSPDALAVFHGGKAIVNLCNRTTNRLTKERGKRAPFLPHQAISNKALNALFS